MRHTHHQLRVGLLLCAGVALAAVPGCKRSADSKGEQPVSAGATTKKKPPVAPAYSCDNLHTKSVRCAADLTRAVMKTLTKDKALKPPQRDRLQAAVTKMFQGKRLLSICKRTKNLRSFARDQLETRRCYALPGCPEFAACIATQMKRSMERAKAAAVKPSKSAPR